jgi:hypothetical protein
MHAKGDDGQSQWAVLVDPTGAAFGVIPVVVDESNGASHLDRIGCISWLSLVVSDVSSMCDLPPSKVDAKCGDRMVSPRRKSAL